MNKSFSKAESGSQKAPEHKDIRSLTDEALVNECISNNRPAWNEFFRRFTPAINKAIKYTFKNERYEMLGYVEGILLKIEEELIEKLLKANILKKCQNPSNVCSWLQTVASNQTINWIRLQNRLKRLPEKKFEGSLQPLDKPLGHDSGFTLEKTIAENRQSEEGFTPEIEDIFATIGDIKDEQKRWVVRLSVVAVKPLDAEELERLAVFNGDTIESVKRQIVKIMEYLEEKEQEKQELGLRAIQRWHEMRAMEAKLWDSNPQLAESEEQQILQSIQEEYVRWEKDMIKAQKIDKPPYSDIAKLVGFESAKANQISSIISRAWDNFGKIKVTINGELVKS